MKNGNPDYCETQVNDFMLNIKLFPSSTSKNSHYDLLGSTIEIGKPSVLKISRDLKEEIGKTKEPYKEVVVEVLDKEYLNTRICIIKELYRYKLMDIEQTILLGYIHENVFNNFAGDGK